jgi:predicted transposase YdaD
MLFGTSKTITDHMTQGSDYFEVRKIYSINIVYFDLGQGDDYIYHGKTHFRGLHKRDELRLSDTQRKFFGKENAADIYPEYYILKINNFNDMTKDNLDEWVYFFKHNTVKDGFRAKGLIKACEILDREKLSPEERKAYDYMMWQRSKDLSDIASSKLEGELEGMKKGREERERLTNELEKEREEREKEREQFTNDLEKEREEREKLTEKYEILLAEIAQLKQNKQT